MDRVFNRKKKKKKKKVMYETIYDLSKRWTVNFTVILS